MRLRLSLLPVQESALVIMLILARAFALADASNRQFNDLTSHTVFTHL
jgi:hypothetical protein